MAFFLTRKLSLAALCLLALSSPSQAAADDKPSGMAPGQKDGKDSIRCDMRGVKSGKDGIRCDMRGVKSGKDGIRCDMRGGQTQSPSYPVDPAIQPMQAPPPLQKP